MMMMTQRYVCRKVMDKWFQDNLSQWLICDLSHIIQICCTGKTDVHYLYDICPFWLFSCHIQNTGPSSFADELAARIKGEPVSKPEGDRACKSLSSLTSHHRHFEFW